MKKTGFVLTVLFVFVFSGFALQERVNEMWCRMAMKSRAVVYEKGDIYELVEFDRGLVERMKDSEFNCGDKGERVLANLIHQMTVDNNKPNEKNTVACIDILAQKLDDKSYVANLILELISVNKVPNYRVLIKILDVYKDILSDDTSAKVFMGLSMLYGKLDAYIFDPNAPGGGLVLKAFLNFIDKYCDLVTNKKTLKDSYRKKIYEYAEKLDLGKKSDNKRESPYTVVSNWETVGRNFYFYKIREEYNFDEIDDAKEANGK